MKRIGLLSDTHGMLHPRIFEYFNTCDEIWHAGDIGSPALLDTLETFKPTKAVFGNIDGYETRIRTSKILRFMCEDVDVLLTHIGGYPGKYAPEIRTELYAHPPKLFVCGHSHILKVKFDPRLQMLCMNPGAAGRYGFQTVSTIMRFEIDGSKIDNLEVIELRDWPPTKS